MRKFYVLLLTLLVTPLCAGVYGMLHDQLTYTIAPEYYTAFKFNQFGIADDMRDRIGVCVVGWRATWWTGLPIGLGLGLAALIHSSWRSQWRYTVRSIGITLLVALAVGLLGLVNGEFLKETPAWVGESILDKRQYAAVGYMHNYSYVGGLIGLGAGIIYHVVARNKERKKQRGGARR